MLVGHAFFSTIPIIFAFHMPLFFIVSGYNIKRIDKKDFIKASIKDFKRLMVPCIVARVIILFGNCLYYGKNLSDEVIKNVTSLLWGNHAGTLFGIVMPDFGRIWFLPALFWTKLFYRMLMMYYDEKSRFYILLPLSFVSMFLGMHGYFLPQNFDMIFLCMLFVEIGSIFKTVDVNNIRWYSILVCFAIWTYFACSKDIYISMNLRTYPGYGLCILVAIAANICVFLFGQSIEKTRIAKLFIFYGKNSLILLLIESITPFFYIPQTTIEKLMLMLLELFMVGAYVLVVHKRNLLKGKFRNRNSNSM